MADTSDDEFLDGKILIRQPLKGYRAGSDALLLAAALPNCSGKMLEVGAGVGTPSLCYLARIGDAQKSNITAIEKFENVAKLAQYNADKNGFSGQIKILNADIFEPAIQFERLGLTSDSFEHIYSNPPFFDPQKNKTSNNDYKALAHSIKHDDLARWLIFMVRLLKNKALMTIIYPMEQLYDVLKILENRIGDISIRPIFSKPLAPATRFLLQGKKGSRAPIKLLNELHLRHDDGSVTEFAEGIFRHGNKIIM